MSDDQQPRRDSWQGFGRPERVIFYGRDSEPWPAAEGRVCRVARLGFNGMMFVDDAAGGEVVASMGGTAKFWGLLLPPDEPPDEGWHPYNASDPEVARCDECGEERRLHP